YRDAEDLDGIFSGYNADARTYDNATWQYDRTQTQQNQRAADNQQAGVEPQQPNYGFDAAMAADTSQNFDALVKALVPPREQKDPTLQHPNSAFQILKRHYARYTPEMVEQVCGSPRDKFFEVAQTLVDNSGPERTGSMAYAVAWTQHTIGVQIIRASGILQQLLGNIGRPGGGILALRGHGSIQGSTDNPTLYHSITGYMSHPSILKRHETLKEYLATETVPTSYYANQPKFMVSYLKALYGNAATRENDFGYAWHPRILGDHSHIPMMVNMADGKVRGMYAIGQNPAVGGQNAGLQRRALANLAWLVLRDYFETETASTWNYDPEPSETLEWRIKDEPSALKILKEINGYDVATGNHLSGFGAVKDDGSTVCGNWIYSGVFPAPDRNLAASRKPDNYVSLG